MTTLAAVIVEGAYANLPLPGMAGRTYYATDTQQTWYDNGTAWVNVTPYAPPVVKTVALVPAAPGNFTIAHGLSALPVAVIVCMTSGGAIWFQTVMFDANNLYLVASEAGVTGNALVIES